MKPTFLAGVACTLVLAIVAWPQASRRSSDPAKLRYEFASVTAVLGTALDGTSSSLPEPEVDRAVICYFGPDGCTMEETRVKRQSRGYSDFQFRNAQQAAAARLGREGWERQSGVNDQQRTVLYFQRQIN